LAEGRKKVITQPYSAVGYMCTTCGYARGSSTPAVRTGKNQRHISKEMKEFVNKMPPDPQNLEELEYTENRYKTETEKIIEESEQSNRAQRRRAQKKLEKLNRLKKKFNL
jgi:hypothetical protein